MSKNDKFLEEEREKYVELISAKKEVLNWSYQDFTDRLGYSRSYISDAINGTRKLRLEVLLEILNGMGSSVEIKIDGDTVTKLDEFRYS